MSVELTHRDGSLSEIQELSIKSLSDRKPKHRLIASCWWRQSFAQPITE
jgi:hypothetical protein